MQILYKYRSQTQSLLGQKSNFIIKPYNAQRYAAAPTYV